jgi:hypothetical protein
MVKTAPKLRAMVVTYHKSIQFRQRKLNLKQLLINRKDRLLDIKGKLRLREDIGSS